MTSKECDDLIDKAVASGVLDSSGDLNFNMRGSREEIIAGNLGRCATWNMPMIRFSAERLADSALRVIRRRRWLWVMWIAIPLILAMAVLFTIVAARRAILDDETGPSESFGLDTRVAVQQVDFRGDLVRCFDADRHYGSGQARAALQQQLDMLEADPVDPKFGLNEHEQNTIVLHLKKAISAYDALMKEYSNAQRA